MMGIESSMKIMENLLISSKTIATAVCPLSATSAEIPQFLSSNFIIFLFDSVSTRINTFNKVQYERAPKEMEKNYDCYL